MLELNNEEKQLIIAGLNLELTEIEWNIEYPYVLNTETEEEYFSYYNNRKHVIKQLLEKLNESK